jgi:hypothetical protein
MGFTRYTERARMYRYLYRHLYRVSMLQLRDETKRFHAEPPASEG